MGTPAIGGGTFVPPDLGGRVAVVTGATRGVGRGIAEVLGQCGATVYVTGRSTRAEPTLGEASWSVEDAADSVTELGGRGVPVRLDHRDDVEVRAFFERVGADEGRIDILVGNATGNDYHGDKTLRAMYSPVWMKPLGWWDANHGVGVRSNFVACRFGLPHMVGRPGLVILTSEPISDAPTHPDPVYDLRAHTTHRMARTFGEQLRSQQVTMLCLVPGDVQTHSRRQGHEDEPIPVGGETVHLAGRAVASLAADPDVLRHAGTSLRVADCAEVYGFTDAVVR